MKYPLRKGWIPSRRNYPFPEVGPSPLTYCDDCGEVIAGGFVNGHAAWCRLDPNDVAIPDSEHIRLVQKLADEQQVRRVLEMALEYDKEAERERRGYREDQEFGKYSGA